MISVLGIGGVFVLGLFFGWLGGMVNIQLIDDRNLRRQRLVDADTEAKLAEGRANLERAAQFEEKAEPRPIPSSLRSAALSR